MQRTATLNKFNIFVNRSHRHQVRGNPPNELEHCPSPKWFCGNGKVEGVYGENSDDGNTLNGDVCSSVCKVESGWECLNYGSEKQRRL